MVPKHLRKSDETLGGDQESLMALIELQGRLKNDKSILRQPIETGVRGVRDLIKAVVGGTHELQELLLNECTIIYECKICKNLFRSLANFISHKRIYCINSFSYFPEEITKQEKEVFEKDDRIESNLVNCSGGAKETKVWLSSDRIVPNDIKSDKNNCLKPTRRIKISPVKITRKCDIAKIADGLNKKARKESIRLTDGLPGSTGSLDIAESVLLRRGHGPKFSSQLENLSTSYISKVFENGKTCAELWKLPAIEKISPCNEAVLQEDGKFRVTPQGMKLEGNGNFANFKCTVCETHFFSKQTLTRHVQIHHKERICYPCPICRTFFPSPTSTYRHLSKEHHKTEQQIRRLRPKILAKASKRKLVDSNSKLEEVNGTGKIERLNAIADGVLHCGICGKLFSRQAVLRVHLTSCREREISSEKTCSPVRAQVPNHKLPLQAVAAVSVVPETQVQQKSGILVRRDYCKKLNSGTSFEPAVKNTVVESQLCKEHSLKRVNKWRTVLQKLQSKNGLVPIERPDVKQTCS
ncbi:hypothetical protein RUM44_005350 [Polyplax serrata]|uniref:C2H2-type domain-containing protein n=1 Tax=Polyplax serrata TaxID=468196 RepID=A0ABR1AEX0_POLSC